jgi:2',3'-cyclic-nucleotide 2'-phosphodiesterase (5'-nucleotidase family)
MRLNRFALVVFSGVFLVSALSCRTSKKSVRPEVSAGYLKVTGAEDTSISRRLLPYRSKMKEQMDVKVVTALGDFTTARPEGSMNNLVADIMRRWGSHLAKRKIHLGLVNNGGLRTAWKAGPITVGDVFELMPFDNRLVLLQITGRQVQQLADELAEKGGEGISGMRFTINEGKATDLLLGNRIVQPDSLYWISCSDYIADNKGYLPSLEQPVKREDHPLYIRDVIIAYLKSKETITPELDGRVRRL